MGVGSPLRSAPGLGPEKCDCLYIFFIFSSHTTIEPSTHPHLAPPHPLRIARTNSIVGGGLRLHGTRWPLLGSSLDTESPKSKS